MIVDDDPAHINLLTFELMEMGFEVFDAANGDEAVRDVRTLKPDIIIMDVVMPVMDGIEAVKILKSDPLTRDIPVIMHSILADSDTVLESYDFRGGLLPEKTRGYRQPG